MDKYRRPVARILHEHVQRTVQQSAGSRNVMEWCVCRVPELMSRWKPLEAALALLGGLSEDVRDLLEDEADSAEKSIELALLFEQVIPALLDQSGMLSSLKRADQSYALSPGPSICICLAIRRHPPRISIHAVPRRGRGCDGQR